jgi:hypothetical protein
MDNQQRTRFMSDWIRAQEQVRRQQDRDKWLKNRRQQRESTREYNYGKNRRSTDAGGDS